MSVASSAFVGRRDESAAIATAAHAAASGRATVVWIEGPPGSGKTALLEHALTQLPDDFGVHRAAAEQEAGQTAFAVVSELHRVSTATPFAAGLELLDAVDAWESAGPVAMVVEDLHWADSASRAALLTTAKRLGDDRVLMLVTSRPDSADDGWQRFRLGGRNTTLISTDPFTVIEVGELARRHGKALPGPAVARLHAHTDGHALYVQTLLGELSTEQLCAPGDLPVPRSLASTTVARLAELPSQARELALALAVVGRPMPLALAGRIAGIGDPSAALDGLLGAGLVVRSGDGVGYAHPLYRAATYADLPSTRRRDLHAAAAAALGGAEALAHRVAAADGPDAALSADLAHAADRAVATADRSQAARLLTWASTVDPDPAHADTHLLTATRLLIVDGQVARAARLRDRVEATAYTPLRSLVLGMLAWEDGRPAEAETLLRDATSATGDADGTTTEATARLGTLYFVQNRGQEAVAAAQQVLAREHTGDVDRIAWTALSVGETASHGAPAGLAALARRLPGRADEVAGLDTDLLVVRGTLAFYAGRLHTGTADLKAAIAAIRGGADATQLPRAHLQLAHLQVLTGDWGEALVHGRLALDLVSEERLVWMQAQAHAVLTQIAAVTGRFDDTRSHLEAAERAAAQLATVEAVFTTYIARAAIARARNDPRGIVDAYGPLLADPANDAAVLARLPMSTALSWWVPIIAALCDLGETDRAATHIDLLEAAASERGLDLDERILGLRAHLRVTRERAGVRAAEAATDEYRRAIAATGADVPLLDRIDLHHRLGRLLAARGDRAGAITTLREAHSLIASAPPGPYRARVDADLAAVAGAEPARRGDATAVSLTERETDVAVLVAKGSTNREVAAQLYVSEKAVEYHLRHIFAKLGIRSRRQMRDHPQFVGS